MAEHRIEGRNHFSSIYMPVEVQEGRQPIPLGSRIRIQCDCIAIDDEMPWLLAIIRDTRMRLSEAAKLYKNDIILEVPIP